VVEQSRKLASSGVRVPCDTELDEQGETVPIDTFAEQVGAVEHEDRHQRHVDPAPGWRKAAEGPHVSALQACFADHQVAAVAKRAWIEVGSAQVRKGTEQSAVGRGHLVGPIGDLSARQLEARDAGLKRCERRVEVPILLCFEVG